MPNIGRPQQQNPYKKIQMANSSQKQRSQQERRGGSRANSGSEVGRQLNRMAGVQPEKQFKSFEEHTQLDKDGFLKLLSHQLQNQDPMKPMDQKKFAADLAQFSQLEQMTNMNGNIESLAKENSSKSKFYGASFLGKEVFTKGSTLNHKEGTSTDVPFFLDKPAKKVLVRIYDEQNQLVSTVEKEGMSDGQKNVRWDGVALDDTNAAPGKYRAEVWAWDGQMNKFKGETQASGQVTGVHFKDGETVLVVDGQKEVFLRDVQRFNLAENGQSSDVQAAPSRGQNSSAKAPAQQLQDMSDKMKEQLQQRSAAKMPGLQKQAQSAYDNRDAR